MVKMAKKTEKGAKEDKVNKRSGKAMSQYRLLAGGLEMADPLWEPTEEEVEAAKIRGTIPRAPTKSYNAGQTFYSDKDMVALCGANKVQLLGSPATKGNLEEDIDSDPTPQNLENGLVHPAGQVNTGFQQTGGVDNHGHPMSGIISREELEEKGLLPEPVDIEKGDAKNEERRKAREGDEESSPKKKVKGADSRMPSSAKQSEKVDTKGSTVHGHSHTDKK